MSEEYFIPAPWKEPQSLTLLNKYLREIRQKIEGEIATTSFITRNITITHSEEFELPNTLESDNFVAGKSGFQIKDTGDAELGNLIVRGDANILGTLEATNLIISGNATISSGTIGGWSISDNKIEATSMDGVAKIGNITLDGLTGLISTKNNVSYELKFYPDGLMLRAKMLTVDYPPVDDGDYIKDITVKDTDDNTISSDYYYYGQATGRFVKRAAYANVAEFPDSVKIDYTLWDTSAQSGTDYTDEAHTFMLQDTTLALVSLDGAVDLQYVKNLKVGTADIIDASITTAKVVSLTADKITAGTYTGGDFIIGPGGSIQSYDYVAGTSGFILNPSGGLEVNTGTIRGDLVLIGTGSLMNLIESNPASINHDTKSELETGAVSNTEIIGSEANPEVVLQETFGSWTVNYTADALPDESDPVWTKTGTADDSVSGGVLTINAQTGLFNYYRADVASANATGNTMEARMKQAGTRDCFIAFKDGTKDMTLQISSSYIQDYYSSGESNKYYMNTTDDYHIYRITLKSNIYKVYVDGVERISGTPEDSAVNKFNFGLISSGEAGSLSYWDYVKYYTGGDQAPDFPASGTLISDELQIDASGQDELGTIEWAENLPTNTDIEFQTRTGATTPVDGTWEGWLPATELTDPDGSQITSTPNTYIQYKAILTTTDSTVTPRLHLESGRVIRLNYSIGLVKLAETARQLKSEDGTIKVQAGGLADIELDYMEYSSDALAQAAYVSSDAGYTADKIPTMISNTAPSGVASANHELRAAWYAMDDVQGTGATNGWIGTGITNMWLQYQFTSGKIITRYTLQSQTVTDEDRMPNDFHLKASNIGAFSGEEVTLDSQTDQVFSLGEKKIYSFSNSNPYTYYRLVIDTINGDPTYTQIDEWELMETILQCYSESTIKEQGSYSLKVVAKQTDSLNDTLTRTVDPTKDLSDQDTYKLSIYASRTGSNIKIGIHDSGGTTTEITPNVTSSNTQQLVTVDLSGVANANKDAIDSIIITIINADADNTFYVDDMLSPDGIVKDIMSTTNGLERMRIDQSGRVMMYYLPTSNPNIVGALWNDSGDVKISAG